MSDTENKDLQDKPIVDMDDDFDYLKEIEAIEAQERELEEQRKKKKAELDKLREERAKAQQNKAPVQKKREETKKVTAEQKRAMKERKKEAEWLGEAFDDGVKTVSVPKKKSSKKGLIAAVIVILLLAAAGSVYVYKLQMDKKTVSDFEQKVASFQLEKLDGVDYGTHAVYFNDFMKQCQDAVEAGDLKAIAELEQKWREMEDTLTEVSNGKTSLDAFAAGVDTALASYAITDDYKKTYETLKKDIQKAQKDCSYEQVADLQKRLDSLATNLKADNMKVIQNLKNDIAGLDMDKNYTTDEQKEQLKKYGEKTEKYIKEENYAEAVNTLKAWKKNAGAVAETIKAKKAEEAARAESEAESRRRAESIAAESRAKAEAESRRKESNNASANSKPSGGSSSSSNGDYVLPGSSSRYLSASEVKNLSGYQLMIARNEIYARHGRKFNDKDLQKYFNGKSWYKGTIAPEDFSVSVFNDYEIKNIDLIVSYE